MKNIKRIIVLCLACMVTAMAFVSCKTLEEANPTHSQMEEIMDAMP